MNIYFNALADLQTLRWSCPRLEAGAFGSSGFPRLDAQRGLR